MADEKRPGNRGDRILMGRFLAAVDQLAHTGMSSFEASFDDDLGEMSPVKVLWRCEGNWQGHRVFSAYYSYPAQAAEDLLERVVNGGTCTNCGRTTIVGVTIDGLCSRTLTAHDVDDSKSYRYVKACAGQEENPEWVKPTKLRLRDDLIAAKAPREMIEKATVGYYDDYESPVADNIVQLVTDARAAGLNDFAEAAMDGAYDGTKEESDAWAASPEGQAVMSEFPPEMREKLFGEVKRRAESGDTGRMSRQQRREQERKTRKGKQ